MDRRFWILFIMTLALFAGGGFYLGYSGLMETLRAARATPVRVLTEQGFLFPDSLKSALESRLPIRLEIEVAEDPDAFLEKAARADLLWARKDWILRTELLLKDFKSEIGLQRKLNQSLSADFFDPEETSSTLLPLLWTLPVVRVPPGRKNQTAEELWSKPGSIRWPFWGLKDHFPGVPEPKAGPEQWILFPVSAQTSEIQSFGDLWFPAEKLKPLVICLSFVENDRIPASLKGRIVDEWLDPRLISRLAADSDMAITLVQAEELLPPWKRASALRKIGLGNLLRP